MNPWNDIVEESEEILTLWSTGDISEGIRWRNEFWKGFIEESPKEFLRKSMKSFLEKLLEKFLEDVFLNQSMQGFLKVTLEKFLMESEKIIITVFQRIRKKNWGNLWKGF